MRLSSFALAATLCAQPAFALDPAPAPLSAARIAGGGTFTLALPDRVVTLSVKSESPAPGLASLAARSSDGRVRLYAFAADGVIRSADVYAGAAHWRLVDQAHWVAAGVSTATAAAPAEPYAARGARQAVIAPKAEAANGSYEIRLLMLYTPELADLLGSDGAAAAEAHRLTALTNGIYETNGVPVRLVVGAVEAWDGAGDTPDFYADIDAMAASSFVRGARNGSASDLVVLLRPIGELCGLSSGFNPDEHSDPPQNVDPERDAFNVVAVGDGSCFDDVMAHEIGHSLSAGHDYASSGGYAYWKPYGHALACFDADSQRYFSLMWGQGIGPGGGRSDLITNPNAAVEPPCGAAGADGADASQADNVRAMTEAAPYVAAYRGKAGNVDASPGPGNGSGGGGALSGAGGVLLLLTALLARRRRAG